MKKLDFQRRLAAEILKVGKSRVVFSRDRLKDIGEAITKEDIRKLIKEGAIKVKPKVGTSRARARKRHLQKKKGRRRGIGKRKGKLGARAGKKELWVNRVRKQRKFLKYLKEKGVIDKKLFNKFYRKVKGGEFRSLQHLKMLLEKELGEKKWQ